MASSRTSVHNPQDTATNISRSANRSSSQKRHRVKTGCLTCRKRRIKCDESHPICGNCTRSHRHCEGYKTPLVFRTSDAASYAYNHFNPSHLHGAGINFYQHQHEAHSHSSNFQQGTYSAMQHAPITVNSSVGISMPYASPAVTTITPVSTTSTSILNDYSHQPFALPHVSGTHNPLPSHFQHHPLSSGMYENINYAAPTARYQGDFVEHALDPVFGLSSTTTDTGIPGSTYYDHPQPSSGDAIQHAVQLPPTTLAPGQILPWVEETSNKYHTRLTQLGRHSGVDEILLPTISSHAGYQNGHDLMPGDSSPPMTYVGNGVDDLNHNANGSRTSSDSDIHYVQNGSQQFMGPTGPHATMSLEVDPYFPRVEELLLNDPYTRSTFQHFMRETGSMLTAFDRSSPLDQPILDRYGRPLAYPGLWTYTMPMMALKNLGLLHAMLALASLQISISTGESSTPSWKHYTYAWRKVHSAVRDPEKRRDLGVFAATMLLAYYEVATADHSKWNMHLSAAAKLIGDVGFGSMSRQLRVMARDRAQARMNGSYDYAGRSASLESVLDHFCDFDLNFVGELMGEPLYTDDTGDVWRHNQHEPTFRFFNSAELADYPIYQDLFWWYIRHDIIHAMVGGTDLLLDYRTWTECPPRASIRQGMDHYGSYDHLMLLMGRLITWTQKDRPRKVKMWKKEKKQSENGRRRSDESQDSSASGGNSNDAARHHYPRPGPSRTTPPFYGMTQSKGQPPLPQAFGPRMPMVGVKETQDKDLDIEQATFKAFDEWNSIRHAFDTFKQELGPEYEPLTEEEYPSFDTPFGRALIYRTNGIACLWAWYYTGIIVALRAQPNMPPFATLAVGAAAAWASTIANTIGRILAGSRPMLSERPLKPSDGSVMGDCVVPLLFAAVQYMDADQRAWTIDWFRRADDLTHFASIPVCATGCEGAWTRMAESGRGPPYASTLNINEIQQSQSSSGSEKETTGKKNKNKKGHPSKEKPAKETPEPYKSANGNFRHLQRGSKVMRAYQLYSADALGDEIQRLSLRA